MKKKVTKKNSFVRIALICVVGCDCDALAAHAAFQAPSLALTPDSPSRAIGERPRPLLECAPGPWERRLALSSTGPSIARSLGARGEGKIPAAHNQIARMRVFTVRMLEEIAARRTLHAAFERVRENAGCRGSDGVTVGGFAASLESELDRLERSLLDRRYRPLPLLRFPVAKRSGGVRWLSVPTVRDRVAQTAVHLVIQDVVEAELEESSYAFRRGRSVRDAIHRVRELRDQGFRWVVDADVDACFDSIAHPLLSARLARLPLPVEVLELLERWVRAEVWDGDRVSRLERGVPQGSVVSPALANLVLDELDEHFALFGRATVRYADDCAPRRRGKEAEMAA